MAEPLPVIAATRPRDPGLQPERTVLAWVRTAAAMMVCGVVALREALVEEQLFLALVGLTMLLGAATVMALTRVRHRRLIDGNGARSVDPMLAIKPLVVSAALAISGVVAALGLLLGR
ncbi:MAG: DUF202 domain-containing protein [Proteobacteria bacterium]|nr:DUF202 domain-containing protein [Pseudomonadota bacterium]